MEFPKPKLASLSMYAKLAEVLDGMPSDAHVLSSVALQEANQPGTVTTQRLRQLAFMLGGVDSNHVTTILDNICVCLEVTSNSKGETRSSEDIRLAMTRLAQKMGSYGYAKQWRAAPEPQG